MKNMKFICKVCGKKFEVEVADPKEAEERRIPSRPVVCPICGGPAERV